MGRDCVLGQSQAWGHFMNTATVENKSVLYAGLLGLTAAILVGLGELLIQFTPDGGITDVKEYAFFNDVPSERLRLGHFLAVLCAPFYLFGYWHLCKMLEPGGRRLAYCVFFLGAYSFIIGAVWIGQRAFLGETVHAIQDGQATISLLTTFSGLNEPLVNVLRISVLLISIIWGMQIIRGNTLYPRWMAAIAPVIILATIFGLSLQYKTAEVYLLPAAMNLTHLIVFSASIAVWVSSRKSTN